MPAPQEEGGEEVEAQEEPEGQAVHEVALPRE